MNINKINGLGSIIQDSKGNDYLAIKIDEQHFSDFIKLMNNLNLNLELSKKEERDCGEYHVTFLNVMEYQKYEQTNIEKLNTIKKDFLNKSFSLNILGLGSISKDENKTYYLIIENNDINNICDKNNLPLKNWHITMGFNNKDLFHAPKDISTIILNIDELNNVSDHSQLKNKKLF